MITFFYLCLVGILAWIVWYSWWFGITPTPTSAKVTNKLLQVLPKEIEGQIAELGSGWGTLAIALARHFSDCQVKAYEISPIPYFVSKLISKAFSCSNLDISRKDFFDIQLNQFSLVVCYLYPGAMERLKIKFEQELSPQAYVLSHTFAVPGWTPILLIHVDDLYQTPIYLYRLSEANQTAKT